jgi:hypothetical protein
MQDALRVDIRPSWIQDPHLPPSPGEAVRRTLPGTTTMSGTVPAGTTSVTLRTPRDIRTLRPSAASSSRSTTARSTPARSS